MKTGKRIWWITGIGIFVVGLVIFGGAYLTELRKQNELSGEIRTAEDKAAAFAPEKLAAESADLKTQLLQVDSQIASLKAGLSLVASASQSMELLNSIAEGNSVRLNEVSSSGAAPATMEKMPFSALPLTITAEGKITALRDFIFQLADTFKTGAMKSADLDIKDGKDQTALATIKMTIYTYEGE